MTKQEYLLTCLMEECAEVIKAASKILRFGTSGRYYVNKDQEDEYWYDEANNIPRLIEELSDVVAIRCILVDEGILPEISWDNTLDAIKKKTERVKHFMEYSRQQGTLIE